MLNTPHPNWCQRKHSWSLQSPGKLVGRSICWHCCCQRRAALWAGSCVGGWEVGAGRRTWGRDCHLLDGIFKPLPAQPCTRQGTAEQATFVVQAPEKLFRDRQAEDAIARTRVAHPALCKLTRTEASEFCGRGHCCLHHIVTNKTKDRWEALPTRSPWIQFQKHSGIGAVVLVEDPTTSPDNTFSWHSTLPK